MNTIHKKVSVNDRRWLTLLAGVLVLLAVSGCDILGFGAIYETTDVSVSVRTGGPSGTIAPDGGSRAVVQGAAPASISAVTITVDGEDKYGVLQSPLATGTLTFDGTVWQGTIPDLPIGPLLTFQASATDAGGTEIYAGSTTVSLSGSGAIVGIVLYPADDGVAIFFPIIRQITRPGEIIHDQTATVSFELEGNSNETLSVGLSSGDFNPQNADVVTASNGSGSLDTTYTAPNTVGTYNHTVSATNSQGNSVTTGFSTVVVYETGDADITIGIAPAIVSLSASRVGNDVSWTATVEDDGPASELSYLWSFDGGLGFADATANPAVLQGYTESVTGTMTLTVTDSDYTILSSGLSSTVSFSLVAGMFPDDVVTEPSAIAVPDSTIAGAVSDIDVADDGTLAKVRLTGSSILLDVLAPDGTVLLDAYVAGTFPTTFTVRPVVVISDVSKRVLVSWEERGSSNGVTNSSLEYTMFDSDLSVLASEIPVWGPAEIYAEFHDAAIDDFGNAVLAYSNGPTHIAFVTSAGALLRAPEIAFDINAVLGTHIAINRSTGEGLVAAQIHSGNGIYYRRFAPDRVWTDPGPVQIPVDYHAWYDGFTMGMNDNSQFAILWRNSLTEMRAKFFAADATLVTEVIIPTWDFEDYLFDSFRARHQQLEVLGNDFILGEVFTNAPAAKQIVRHFRYTPAGVQVAENTTNVTRQFGLSLRMDAAGTGYAFSSSEIAVFEEYLN